MNDLKELNKGERFIVEWQYNVLGSFGMALADAMSRADEPNLNKLSAGYPEEVEAYRNYTRTRGWWADVKRRAGIK